MQRLKIKMQNDDAKCKIIKIGREAKLDLVKRHSNFTF